MPKKWDPVHPFSKSKSSSSFCPIAMPPFSFSPPNHWSGDLICLSSCAKGWDVSMEEKLKYRHQKFYQKKKHPCASQSSSACNSKESAGLDFTRTYKEERSQEPWILAWKWWVTHPATSSPLHGFCRSAPTSIPEESHEPWPQSSASTNFIQPSVLHTLCSVPHTFRACECHPNTFPSPHGMQNKINAFLPLEHVQW